MKTITQEELNKKLELHALWLEDDTKGEILDLSNTDLSNTDLSGVNLSFANLEGADLSNSDLSNSDLSCATLSFTNLSDATLSFTNLSFANLSQANTSKVFGIDIYSIDNIGTFKGKVTYLPEYDTVFAGCWKGSLEEFLEKGLEKNKFNKKEKRNIINAYQFFYGTTID